ncbi:uncharacterized protein SCHCODRAFT_02630344 [Schizophyllum commune H4-8]|uniref:uncharacterized protein n=1 Tax=Schizophyllum commune (strain H4-8 / FGSC 9210) TaxID=578458 RepID=UPI00215F0E07|nr:uncharacterized protein SCHCODRAFT_02630344 [Schizophyllum commune H4-8]KAI5889892.1 hypothetical protein SCHCODRAFT_02630344 [Schizophyllum commune H4-8]
MYLTQTTRKFGIPVLFVSEDVLWVRVTATVLYPSTSLSVASLAVARASLHPSRLSIPRAPSSPRALLPPLPLPPPYLPTSSLALLPRC